MSTFARIKLVARYKKVVYYSIVITDDDDDQTLINSTESLFEIFLKNNTEKNRSMLNHILAWMKAIGETRGAHQVDFRHEKAASALPPDASKKPFFFDNGKKKSNNLRLYCFPANKHVVFLFNGDLKTTKKAQECEKVREHFKLANILTTALNNLMIEKDITWIKDDTDIDFDDNFIFEI